MAAFYYPSTAANLTIREEINELNGRKLKLVWIIK